MTPEPTLRRLLPLRLIHDIKVGAEQPVKEGTYMSVDTLLLETFEKGVLFPVDCEPNTATRL